MTVTGVFPGSFDPLTIAHLAMAEIARLALDLERVVLAVSADPLGKRAASQSAVHERLARVNELAGEERPWLEATQTTDRLIADIAQGFDAVIIGADKWRQMNDVSFYVDAAELETSLARLPQLVVFTRSNEPVPDDPRAVVLELPRALSEVSSSAVRAGAAHWKA